ncbi:octopamine receptor Oamb [Anabrus simplex]|uniref:octopamine receptor Oamb n=1 Tax=Anabrus simplex TaxID=316456 RepID=UPI0034DD591A
MLARDRNGTECDAWPEDVLWDDPGLLASLAVLAIIDIMVIVGNCLVIAAVFMSSKLRSVTNLFIVSLAVADLMVGVAVLPFSSVWEVFKVWIFGNAWCTIWLAVDVWMCTASILNLCAISLDRYVAVTRPVTYPSIMSSSRAKLLIAGVWVLSFVICFPPLVGWKDQTTTSNTTVTPLPCPWTCELTNDAGYVVYSALGSFYIPMFVMLFFYWRIYRAAVRTTHAINQGFRTTKGARGAFGNRFDEQRLTLRIHRGRGSVMTHSSGGSNSTATSTAASPSLSTSRSPSARRLERSRTHERIKISISYPSSDAISAVNNNSQPVPPPPNSPSPNSSKKSSFSSSPPGSVALYAVHYQNNSTTNSTTASSFRNRDSNSHLRVTGSRFASMRRSGRRRSSTDSAVPPNDLSPSPTFDESGANNKPKLISRMGKRNIKAQVKRFRMETKAAKTLGIIVGGFIFCWLPFFTMYLVRAFCVPCIHPIVFSILFWLGYCNSAINPCIYALFSKDFRFAFKRIICRCFCKGPRYGRSQRRGSDGSQLGMRSGADRGRSPSYNEGAGQQHTGQQNSVGEDSDPNNEGSDSR